MDHYQEAMVTLSESVLKIRAKRPLADNYVISSTDQKYMEPEIYNVLQALITT